MGLAGHVTERRTALERLGSPGRSAEREASSSREDQGNSGGLGPSSANVDGGRTLAVSRMVRIARLFLVLVIALGLCSCSAATSARDCCAAGEPGHDCGEVVDGGCALTTSESAKNVFKNLPQFGAIIGEARTTRDVEHVFRHLEKYHGIDRRLASDRLHDIKSKNGLPNDTDLIFDMTGNVYSPTTLELLGSMTQGGAKLVR